VLQSAAVTTVSFDFSASEAPVTVLDAVCFDSTADPQLTTPLGAFNPATKALSGIAIPSGHTRVDRYRVYPTVLFIGDQELVELYAPAIILENLSVSSKDTPGSPFVVARGGYYYSIRSASRTELALDVRLIAETAMELVALRQAVTRLIDEGNRQSPNTGEMVGLALRGEMTLNAQSDNYDGKMKLVIRDVAEWEGALLQGYHTTEADMGLRVTDRGGSSHVI
jgi:hypothetical protein